MKKRKPDDLSQSELANIPGIIVGHSAPGVIEAMEAAGQRQLVEAECLPTEMSGCNEAQLIEDGFELGPVFEDDRLFRRARTPKGWVVKAAPDHDMWSYIYDETGKERYSIFYKAAYYDRRATLHKTQETSEGDGRP